MTRPLTEIIADSAFFQLSGLLGLGLLFVLLGLRELQEDRPEGYLYLMIAIFMAVAHAVLLDNFISSTPALTVLGPVNIWLWLVFLFAPALIALFVLRSLVNFALYQGRDGLFKLFFGLTLLCFVFMLGDQWPIDVRGTLIIIWIAFFFKTEMAIAS
jgi:hypothetical protein